MNIHYYLMANVLPLYVKLRKTALRLIKEDNEYYRDAGNWSTKFKYKDGYLVADDPNMPYHEDQLIPITEDEWKKGNIGYF